MSNNILSLCKENETRDETKNKIILLCNQLLVNSYLGHHQGKQYDSCLISEIANPCLGSQNTYRPFRAILIDQNESALCKFFRKFGSAGHAGQCIQAVNDVFWNLNGYHKKVDGFLAPATGLKHEFLIEFLLLVVKIIHDAGGFVFGTVADNFLFSKIVQNNPWVLHSCHNIFGWISNTKWSDIAFIYKQEKNNIVKKLHSIL